MSFEDFVRSFDFLWVCHLEPDAVAKEIALAKVHGYADSYSCKCESVLTLCTKCSAYLVCCMLKGVLISSCLLVILKSLDWSFSQVLGHFEHAWQSHLSSTAAEQGAAAKQAADKKTAKYQGLETHIFFTVAIETVGSWSHWTGVGNRETHDCHRHRLIQISTGAEYRRTRRRRGRGGRVWWGYPLPSRL